MNRLLAALLLTYSMNASATLFCWNGDNNVGMEYNNGVLSYAVAGQPVGNPGVALMTDGFTVSYCWAAGPELVYLYQSLPDLPYPAATVTTGGGKGGSGGTVTFRKSIQHPDGTVYWTGKDAIYIMNNL